MLEVIILKVQMYPIYQIINCQIYEIKDWFRISELQSDAKINGICQNVELPLTYMKVPKKERRERAMEMLRLVGLEERSEFKPMELSGGQKQRVAIARALVTNPSFILGDEPTGALDTKTSVQIMELFKQFNEAGKTIVIITHEPEVAQMCKKTVVLRDGNIEHKEVERN